MEARKQARARAQAQAQARARVWARGEAMWTPPC